MAMRDWELAGGIDYFRRSPHQSSVLSSVLKGKRTARSGKSTPEKNLKVISQDVTPLSLDRLIFGDGGRD